MTSTGGTSALRTGTCCPAVDRPPVMKKLSTTRLSRNRILLMGLVFLGLVGPLMVSTFYSFNLQFESRQRLLASVRTAARLLRS